MESQSFFRNDLSFQNNDEKVEQEDPFTCEHTKSLQFFFKSVHSCSFKALKNGSKMDQKKCEICSRNRKDLCLRYGGRCCAACAAFFTRFVNRGYYFVCKNYDLCLTSKFFFYFKYTCLEACATLKSISYESWSHLIFTNCCSLDIFEPYILFFSSINSGFHMSQMSLSQMH